MKPSITLSSRDFERIEKLLDSLPASSAVTRDRLFDELDRAEVVAPDAVPPTLVTMNSQVTFTVLPDGKTMTYTLVYPADMDGSPDKISILAPVGSALIGLSVGQEIDWPMAGDKTTRVRIERVDYQPEQAGDFHL